MNRDPEKHHAFHYNDVIMGAIACQITSLTIVFSIVYLDTDQRKHQSSTSLAFVRGIHRRPVNSPHKWPITRKMFPFDDVIMLCLRSICWAGTGPFFIDINKLTDSPRGYLQNSLKRAVHQTVDLSVISDTMRLMYYNCNGP